MSLRLGAKAVTTPDGVEWQVGRRWLTRGFHRSWRPRGDIRRDDIASDALSGLAGSPSDLGFGEELLFLALAVAAVLILIPILFFGIELIIAGGLLGAGILSRVVLRRPWVIQARSNDPLTSGRLLEWQVRGWRRSGRAIDEVISDLAAGREPSQASLPR